MRKYIWIFLIISTMRLEAQYGITNYPNKIIRYSSSTKLEVQKLDSIYLSASHVEKDKSAFPEIEDSVYKCWTNFLTKIDLTLKENDFV